MLNELIVQSLSGLKSIVTKSSPIISENLNCFVYNLKVLQDNAKAWREVELHWKASGCPYIVGIKDVYQNKYGGSTCLLVVMEWFVEVSSHIFVFVLLSIQCSPCQVVSDKIYRLRQHFLPPSTAGSVTKNNKFFKKICKS